MSKPGVDQHVYGGRVEAEHLCPRCGIIANAFCPTCWGTGLATNDAITRYEQEQNYELRIWAPPAA